MAQVAQGFLPPDLGSDLLAHSFLISQLVNRTWTSTLVKVRAVTNAGVVSPVGFIDALPLVNQVDAAGNATPHQNLHHLPYFRLQGGTDAVILDPKVGDIGIALFASHDISSVKANKGQANPGSGRRYDPADGLYIGGVLNGTPAQYLAFSSSGITVMSPSTITVQGTSKVAIQSSSLVTVQAPSIEFN